MDSKSFQRSLPVPPEVLDRIFRYLLRDDLTRLARVSHFFLNVARRHLMSSITIEPRNLDVCQRYITTLVECKTRPPVRRVVFDVAVAMWEVLYYLDKSCSEENTLSLVITSSVRFADWRTLSSIFIKHLIAKLPRVKSLHLKSLECRFQFSLLSAYMSTLVKLTLHSAIARSSAGWTPISFPHLEHIELIQDHSIMLHEDSLPMLMAKYVDAPKLKTGHVACAVEGHIFSVYEFLYAFAETLEEVKVIGDFIYEALDQRLLPRLPALTCLHVEIELVHNIFKFGDTATEYIPRLQRLVMEGDWATMETGSYDVRWADMHRMLTRLMDIYPKPVIVCGYRGAEVRQRNIFARILIHHLLETVGWDIRDIFEVEESRCNPLPPRRPAFTDGKPRLRAIPVVKTTRFSPNSSIPSSD